MPTVMTKRDLQNQTFESQSRNISEAIDLMFNMAYSIVIKDDSVRLCDIGFMDPRMLQRLAQSVVDRFPFIPLHIILNAETVHDLKFAIHQKVGG
jgi:hypothetical protein